MTPDSGRLYTEDDLQKAPKSRKRKAIPLTDPEAQKLHGMSRRDRRAWARANLSRAERMSRKARP
jgi:hypothetical protein